MGFGSVVALVLSSLVFGLLHLGNPGATFLGAVTSAAGGGVVFGTAYMLRAACGWRSGCTGQLTSGRPRFSGCDRQERPSQIRCFTRRSLVRSCGWATSSEGGWCRWRSSFRSWWRCSWWPGVADASVRPQPGCGGWCLASCEEGPADDDRAAGGAGRPLGARGRGSRARIFQIEQAAAEVPGPLGIPVATLIEH